MKKYLLIFLWVLFSCQDGKKQFDNEISTSSSFKEIGDKNLLSIKFPQQWKTRPYNEMPPITESDSLNEVNLNSLDYFDNVKAKRISNISRFQNLLLEKDQIIDSLFLIDSLSVGNNSFIYLKSYKTVNSKNYDFPPTIKEINILVFDHTKFKTKLNVYSKKSYPFAVELKLGYFTKSGILYTKEFKTDEEGTTYFKEEQKTLTNNGNIQTTSSKIIQPKLLAKKTEEKIALPNFKGEYSIETKAISYSTNKEFVIGYFLAFDSNSKAILSINADYPQDYQCEGEYKLKNENNILHARGICDQDDINDFYLKFENGNYYIKSKRFKNTDWQELKKDS
ncbi:hypothetical protein [Chryseobacterium sp. SIMBA_038]|uniref:hypothetical protein n=1 Tax=Chryseobacterium sp. SIMBA_038 TaxID=3085780 RepID=UPI00397CB3BD